MQQEVKDSMAVRKGQKADREKLRRERLNEQFFELGKVLGKLHLYLFGISKEYTLALW